MKLDQDDTETELTESTLPMINVVFLLLIFFTIAGSLQKPLPFEISPPKAQGETVEQQIPLYIHIAADGRLMVEDEELSESDFKKVVREKARFGELGLRPITIRADQATNTKTVVKVLSLLKEMEFKQVALATVR